MELITRSITAKSRCHENNEDSFICKDKYIVVADGMGGEACGDVASKVAISTISSFLDSSLDETCSVAWFGDSRCYYYDSSKRLSQLTTDHSYVQQLIDEGRISADEAFSHPDNNLVTRYVGGGEETCKPEFVSSKLDLDGCVILCSDGLSGYCKNDEIEQELRLCPHDNIPKRLLELAIQKGSDDDITIVTLTPKVESPKCRTSMLSWLKKLKQH